ncbi:lipoate--protein ligase family protein [Aeoliella sp. ICT_H6.2]|uniref:Lipoate--protein ligase family protein n=1 Tax=Aeoliella straminimaris TaxID=2954799 RepID=A0A9X2F981_9BACT|nr:lipoate--protein ligase family protein [Aeoliella straminimaris]MCO6043983.1 lipoate--protein ligase family protein [Aeoliella straminimaris]
MKLLDLTLDSPAENVALDEALLEACLAGEYPHGVLRLWESPSPMVVVGRGSHLELEVNQDACGAAGVPVLRRASGGLSIVAGPGCLMYAVVDPGHLAGKVNIDVVHQHVLDTLVAGLQGAGLAVVRAGTSDLVIESPEGLLRKVSGNSLRVTRGGFLYHGTLLYDFELPLITRYLRQPPRSPDYRAGRSHGEFVANMPIGRQALAQAIAEAWQARENLESWPRARTQELMRTRYATDQWNQSR